MILSRDVSDFLKSLHDDQEEPGDLQVQHHHLVHRAGLRMSDLHPRLSVHQAVLPGHAQPHLSHHLLHRHGVKQERIKKILSRVV